MQQLIWDIIRDGYESKTVTRAYEPHLLVFAGSTARAVIHGRNQNCVNRPSNARWLIISDRYVNRSI